MREFIVQIFVSFILTLVASGLVMWCLTEAHDMDARVPAFGYWTLFWLIVGSRIVIKSAMVDLDD